MVSCLVSYMTLHKFLLPFTPTNFFFYEMTMNLIQLSHCKSITYISFERSQGTKKGEASSVRDFIGIKKKSRKRNCNS